MTSLAYTFYLIFLSHVIKDISQIYSGIEYAWKNTVKYSFGLSGIRGVGV